jgi:mutator protein MutT
MPSTPPQVAVGGIVVSDGRLLMVKRANDPGAGLWTIPGGRVEAGESLTDAVAREVNEETGLDVTVGELAGLFEIPGEPHFVILDYLATPVTVDAPIAGDDAAEVKWVPLGDVKDLECTPRFVELLTAWGVLAR